MTPYETTRQPESADHPESSQSRKSILQVNIAAGIYVTFKLKIFFLHIIITQILQSRHFTRYTLTETLHTHNTVHMYTCLLNKGTMQRSISGFQELITDHSNKNHN